MLLKNYIEKVGDSQAAKVFGVKARTTASWRREERRPRHDQALEIVDKTAGAVTYAECYGLEEK